MDGTGPGAAPMIYYWQWFEYFVKWADKWPLVIVPATMARAWAEREGIL
jgi:hypothetical protein